jgi:hypothetical protein
MWSGFRSGSNKWGLGQEVISCRVREYIQLSSLLIKNSLVAWTFQHSLGDSWVPSLPYVLSGERYHLSSLRSLVLFKTHEKLDLGMGRVGEANSHSGILELALNSLRKFTVCIIFLLTPPSEVSGGYEYCHHRSLQMLHIKAFSSREIMLNIDHHNTGR